MFHALKYVRPSHGARSQLGPRGEGRRGGRVPQARSSDAYLRRQGLSSRQRLCEVRRRLHRRDGRQQPSRPMVLWEGDRRRLRAGGQLPQPLPQLGQPLRKGPPQPLVAELDLELFHRVHVD